MLYSLEKDSFKKLCETFPKSTALIQELSIDQIKHLNEVRQRKMHLHAGNDVNHYYRKSQMFLEKRAPLHKDFDI